MQILVDLYKAANPYSGLGEFTLRFYEELIGRETLPFDLTFPVPKGFEQTPHARVDYRRITPLDRYLPSRRKAPDLWHSLYQRPSHPAHPKSLHVQTIHDLNFLVEWAEADRPRALARLQKSVDRAELLVAISHYTKERIEEHLHTGDREVRVIHNGVRLDEYPEEPRPDYLDDRPYFLSIGVHAAKKNFHVLLPLLRHYPDHLLLLPGRSDTGYGEKVRREAEALGLDERVILPGTISAAEKYRLLTDCDAFLFPSLAEGFGLPVIEALLAGRPTFTSDRTSLPEIGGGATHIWESFDPEEMATVLAEGLRSFADDPGGQAARYRAHGATFSWERSIDAYLSLYSDLLDF